MRRIALKTIVTVILGYVFLCLATPFNKFLRNRSIENQIHYLSGILEQGYDDELQSRFPEGKLFSNSLLALSIIEYCDRNRKYDEVYALVVDNCIKRIQSQKARDAFDNDIEPKYGMFYNGWASYVNKSYIKSQLFRYSSIQEKVREESKLVENRLVESQRGNVRILETYAGASWPADNFVGIISLENDSIRESWVNAIFNLTKSPSGLIHHSGNNTFVVRGSSSAMITFCLSKLYSKKAHEYNNTFKEKFIEEYLGVQLVLENEDGTNKEDVDSGPVIFGYGASATIMNIKTQASIGSSKAKSTWAVLNLISLPINIFQNKFYLFKQEPMLDVFMLWSSVEL